MTMIEILSKVDDMLSLIERQKNHDLNYFFKVTNMKTSVATDQINHLIEAVNDRHMRTAMVYLDDMSMKSSAELIHQLSIRFDYFVYTITSLRRKIIEQKDEIKKKLDSTKLLDQLIEQEYMMMREKYSSLLQSSYDMANQTMEQKESMHRESLENYLHDLQELKNAYHTIEDPTTTNHDSNFYHENNRSKAFALRNSFVNRRSSVSGKTIAQENNELTLAIIQEKLDVFHESLFRRSVESYEKRIKDYPLQRLSERKLLFDWKKKQVESMDHDMVSMLRTQEAMYGEIIEKLITETKLLDEKYNSMYIHMWQLEEERRLLISESYIDDKILAKVSSKDKAIEIARRFRIGSQMKLLATLAEMNVSDIKHILLVLATSAKSRKK